MFEDFKYHVKLNRLFRKKYLIRTSYDIEIRKALKDKQLDEVAEIRDSRRFEDDMIDEEIAVIATNNLIRKARRRFVPLPLHDDQGMWQECEIVNDQYVLTDKGVSHLRSLLRAEHKEQIESFVIVVTCMTGFIGVVTGLIAVIMK
jgi:hypothetical protein